MAEVICTKCGQKLRVGQYTGSVKITCPKCGQSLILRQGTQPSASAAARKAPAPVPTPQAPAHPASLPREQTPLAGFPQSPVAAPTTRRSTAKPGATRPKNLPLIIGGAVAGVALLAGLGFAVSTMLGEEEPPATPNDRIAAARERAGQMRSNMGMPPGSRGAAIAAETERVIEETNRAIDADIAKMEANIAAGNNSSQRTTSRSNAYIDSALVSDISKHQRAVAEFVAITGRFGDLLEQTKGNLTTESRASLRELEDAAWTLSDRITALPRLDSASAKEASKFLRLDAAGSARDKRVQQQVEQYRPRITGRSNTIAFNKATGRLSEARNALIASMITPKKPTGSIQDLEYRLYDANRAVLDAFFSGNQADVGNAIVRYTQSLKTYQEKWGSLTNGGQKPFSNENSPFSGWYAWSTGALQRHVEPTLPSNLATTYQEFMDLQASFEPQDMTAVQRIQAKHAKFHEDAQKQHQRNVAMGSSQSGKNVAPEEDWALGQQIKFFRGDDTGGTVIIHVEPGVDFFKQRAVFDALKQSLGLESRPRQIPGSSKSAIGIKYSGSLEDVVKAISFGTVTEVDQQQRFLYCDVAPEWASKSSR